MEIGQRTLARLERNRQQVLPRPVRDCVPTFQATTAIVVPINLDQPAAATAVRRNGSAHELVHSRFDSAIGSNRLEARDGVEIHQRQFAAARPVRKRSLTAVLREFFREIFPLLDGGLSAADSTSL